MSDKDHEWEEEGTEEVEVEEDQKLAARKDRDTDLWVQWHEEKQRTGLDNNQYWKPLFQQMAPAAHTFVRKYAGKTEIPEAVLETKAKEGVIHGIREWDPNHKSGAALFSFVTTSVNNRTRRFVQERQGPVRIPEHRGWGKITEFNSALEEYEAVHGYEPNDDQLAGYLNWPKAHVEKMRRDLQNSAPGVGSAIRENVTIAIPKEDLAITELKFQLRTGRPADEQKLKALELFLDGKNGQEVARQLGIGESKVSQLRRELTNRLGRELGRRR